MVGFRALVTGGAGFIGFGIVQALIARGDDVCVLDNLDPRVHGNEIPQLPEKVSFVHGDVLSRSSLADAFKEDVDVVFHETAMVGLGTGGPDAEAYTNTNVIGTIRLMETIMKLPNSTRPRLSTLVLHNAHVAKYAALSLAFYPAGVFYQPHTRIHFSYC